MCAKSLRHCFNDPLSRNKENPLRNIAQKLWNFLSVSSVFLSNFIKQLLLPYPQYTGITLDNDPVGSSYYDAMDVRVEKRISQFDTKSADQPMTGDHIRTLPTQVAHARADGINSLDLSISKDARITERLHAQLRGDFFNALNHPQFSAPNLSPTSSGFGENPSQANLPRQVQVELRLIF